MLQVAYVHLELETESKVYLDESLKRYDTVYPAAGNDHSAVKLTIVELEEVAGASGWIDVCK